MNVSRADAIHASLGRRRQVGSSSRGSAEDDADAERLGRRCGRVVASKRCQAGRDGEQPGGTYGASCHHAPRSPGNGRESSSIQFTMAVRPSYYLCTSHFSSQERFYDSSDNRRLRSRPDRGERRPGRPEQPRGNDSRLRPRGAHAGTRAQRPRAERHRNPELAAGRSLLVCPRHRNRHGERRHRPGEEDA